MDLSSVLSQSNQSIGMTLLFSQKPWRTLSPLPAVLASTSPDPLWHWILDLTLRTIGIRSKTRRWNRLSTPTVEIPRSPLRSPGNFVGLIGTPIGSATRSSVPLVGRIRIASLSSAMTGCLKSGKAFDYWRIRWSIIESPSTLLNAYSLWVHRIVK